MTEPLRKFLTIVVILHNLYMPLRDSWLVLMICIQQIFVIRNFLDKNYNEFADVRMKCKSWWSRRCYFENLELMVTPRSDFPDMITLPTVILYISNWYKYLLVSHNTGKFISHLWGFFGRYWCRWKTICVKEHSSVLYRNVSSGWSLLSSFSS